MQDFFTIISNFGFPVAVASYLLFRFEKKLEELAEVNRQLTDTIKELQLKILELEQIIKRVRR
jgi:hypothetical protein